MNYLFKILPIVFYVILAFFLALYLTKVDYSKFQNISIDWTLVISATAFGLSARFWGAYVWVVILEQLSGQKIKHRMELFYIYAKSWMARYIPGTAAWIVSKVYFASKLGISKNKLAVSSLLEAGLQVTVVMGSAIALLLIDSRFGLINSQQKYLMFAALAVCIVALVPSVFNRIVSVVYKLVKRKVFPKEHHIGAKIVLRGTSLYLIWSLLGGVSLFFLAKSVYPALEYHNILFIIGASNLAGALSMLAFFAPSGLGVREGIILILLSIVMPTEIALVITIFTRLWSVVLDFMFFSLTYLFESRSTN